MQSRLRNITLENVHLTLDRWTDQTKYPGAIFDNRPSTAQVALEPHNTPGFLFRHADQVSLNNCAMAWGKNIPDSFAHALEAQDVTNLTHPDFQGTAAHAERDQAILIT